MGINGANLIGMATGSNLAPLRYYCQQILPAVFDDSMSYYELVCVVAAKCNEIIAARESEGSAIEDLQKFVEGLSKELDEFKAHGFDDYYKAQVKEWIDSNLKYIYDETIKQVFFGLTMDGYFVAYVPDSWADIQFETDENPDSDNYGRLILKYDVDSAREVIQP